MRELPAVTRCVLRAASNADYMTVVQKPIGEYSLQSALSTYHADLSLGQQLPATADYPALTVVDMTPATRCALVPDAEPATFIVLPPAPRKGPPSASDDSLADGMDSAVEKAEATAEVVYTQRCVCVECDHTLPEGSPALASSALLEELLVPNRTVIRAGDSDTGCAFVLEEDMTGRATITHLAVEGHQTGLRLRTCPSLFRNIRAGLVRAGAFSSPEAQEEWEKGDALTYASCSFTFPLDCLDVVEDITTGEPLVVQDEAQDALCVERLVLCPAFDDFFLSNTFGDFYADTITTILGAAAPTQLRDRFVSEGDVLTIAVTPDDITSGTRNFLDGLDVAESVLKHLTHKMSEAETLCVAEGTRTPSPFLTAFRVVEVRTTGGATSAVSPNYGVVKFDTKKDAMSTELALVSQQRAPYPDSTPILPPQRGPLRKTSAPEQRAAGSFADLDLDFYDTLRHALADACVVPTRHPGASHNDASVLVVHGVKENFPLVFVEQAARNVGLVPLYVSPDAVESAEELRTLLQKFTTEANGIVLVVRQAQTLAEEYAELLPLLSTPGSDAAGRGPCITILVCETIDAVPPAIAARATNVGGVLQCGNPSEADRRKVVRHCLRQAASQFDFHISFLLSFDAVAAWTVGISFADLVELAEECAVMATRTRYTAGPRPVLSEDICETVVQAYLKDHGHNLVSTKLTPVRWSDVGGLEDAKRELKETIQLPILHPEMFANGMKKRTGILFYGPPGCGKTLLAKAVATEMNMNFMSVKGPELINQYVGESERNIRLLFQRARDSSPCIVFFDELDALAPARGAKGDAGGAMDRIVSQLLVEVDGVGQQRSDGTTSGDVFIIGATNRPDLLDPSLLRPGRFDRLCYLGIPSSDEEQLFALKALTRKFDLGEDVSLEALIEPLDYLYTGADFFALCSDAMMFSVEDALEGAKAALENAMTTEVAEGDHLQDASDSDESGAPIQVFMRHFVRARDQLKPSVTKDDLKKYEALKAKFNK